MLTGAAAPLEPETGSSALLPLLARSLDDLRNSPDPVVIAVSGGGDSMALLDLYATLAESGDGWPTPVAVTVDHGLRAGFGAEAALVERLCARRGIAHSLKRWTGDKPSSGVMAASRLARYRLLGQAAGEAGATTILIAHTSDDMAETAAMQAARGGDPFGFEAAVLYRRRRAIRRPLAAVSRAALRGHLVEAGIRWADDPSNANPGFERTRVRYRGVTPAPDMIASAQASRARLAERAAAWLSSHAGRDHDGPFLIRAGDGAGDGETQAARALALRYLAAALGGDAYPAAAPVANGLAGLLDRPVPNGTAYTAARCRFVRTGERIRIEPDPRHGAAIAGIGRVEPFEIFAPQGLLPLANGLAAMLGAAPFRFPPMEGAAI